MQTCRNASPERAGDTNQAISGLKSCPPMALQLPCPRRSRHVSMAVVRYDYTDRVYVRKGGLLNLKLWREGAPWAQRGTRRSSTLDGDMRTIPARSTRPFL